ncbi:MAG: type I-E CRISPR-associated endoribonuclease Cas2e, partial [Chloroflexota bacterium]
MVVFMLEKVPRALRGELTRWLLEPSTGVFVGRVSGMVRDRLWDKVCANAAMGGAVLCHASDSEQGFSLRFHGATKRRLVDFEGLY